MARKALKALSQKTLTYVEIANHFAYLKKERNDQAVAILASTLVEDALEGAILSRLAALPSTRTLLDFDQPLGTFSAKIRIAFALCLIGSFTRADLDCMRDIRNAFAHPRVHMKFTTPEVEAACQTLQNKTSKKRFRKNASPRFRYLETAEKITHDLLGEALEGKQPNQPSLP
jgi:hypothetical protein